MSEIDLLQFEGHFYELEALWRGSSQPDLRAFVAGRDGPLALECLIELVKIDCEHRLSRIQQFDVRQYWEWFAELDRNDIRDDLILYEWELRQKLQLVPQDNCPQQPTINTAQDESVAPQSVNKNEAFTAGCQVQQYTIEQVIGAGSFARVYQATDNQLRRKVALKFLRPELSQRGDASKRMLLEAQAVSAFQHDNIVPVFEIGKHDEQDFIVSRFVDGATLDQILAERKLDIKDSARIVSQLADALHHAHCRGVIHRDVKPANIMLENDRPLLLDFGLAHFSEASVHLTNAGDVLGTPAYMAPEQADGRAWQADPRTDVYSLGAVLFQMVVGRLPFEGNSANVIQQLIDKEPTPPRKLNPSVDLDLNTMILMCLQKDPRDRYQSAAAFREDLNRYLSGNSIHARPVGLLARTRKWSKRRPAVATMASMLILAAAFLVGMASQIVQVSRQRDQAQNARAETQRAKQKIQKQLAAEAADAGQLAMQRGQMKNAVDFFNRSVAMGYDNQIEIRFKKLESLLAIRELDLASAELSSIIPLFGAADNSNTGLLLLWQAELSLDGYIEYGTPVKLFNAAINHDLPIAEASYVQGMLSRQTVQAVAHFRDTIESDAFHFRARKMLVITLISLGRFDEAISEIRTSRQLFPEDSDFDLFAVITDAATNKDFSFAESLNDLELTESNRKSWKKLCDDIHQICFELVVFPGAVGYSENLNAQLASRFVAQHLPLLNSRGWHFPPVIGNELVAIGSELLEQKTDPQQRPSDVEDSIDLLQELVDIHTEGTLLSLYADRLSTHYNLSLASNASPPDGLEEIQKALAAFETSVEIPGWVDSVKQTSRVGIMGAALALFHRHQIKVEANQELFIQTSMQTLPTTIESISSLRAIAVALITLGAYDEAVRWCDRWLQVAGDENLDAVWHRAVLDRWRERWLEVLQQSSAAIERFPDYEPLQGLHGRATAELKKELGLQNKTPRP